MKLYMRGSEKTWLDEPEIDVAEYIRSDLAYHLHIHNKNRGIPPVGLIEVATGMDSKYKLGEPKKTVRVGVKYYPLENYSPTEFSFGTYIVRPARSENIEVEVSTNVKRKFGLLKRKFIKLVTKQKQEDTQK